MKIRKWKLSTDTQGQTAILGPPLPKGAHLFVADLNAVLELMEIINRQMVRLGGVPPYADAIKQITSDVPMENDFDIVS
jgi:hypothetical protein